MKTNHFLKERKKEERKGRERGKRETVCPRTAS
jgi:hypothetical protein